ncbi:MAG: cupin domain-containing protein [Proteobacteria bacterium]|nr:cupin domain-containing protein [Pseudomonadota bacterium]
MSLNLIRKDNRNEYRIGDQSYFLILDGADTGERCSLFETVMPPGCRALPHTHTREHESLLVLAGALNVSFLSGDKKQITLHAGDFVKLPKDIHYSLHNLGTTPVHALVFFVPAGMESYLKVCSDPHLTGKERRKLALGYGVEYIEPDNLPFIDKQEQI